MDVELRVVDLLLVLHQLSILNLFWSIFLLFTEASAFKTDKRQRSLVEATGTMVDVKQVEHGLTTKVLPSDDLFTE